MVVTLTGCDCGVSPYERGLDGKKVITVPNAPKLPFSPAIKAGDYIFVSGQVGFMDTQGKKVKEIEAQT